MWPAKRACGCVACSKPTAREKSGSKPSPSGLKTEGREIRIAVVVVLVLRPLQEADHAIGHRRHHDLPPGLEHVLRERDLDHVAARPDAVERDEVEQR